MTQVLDVEEDAEHGVVLVFELLEGESLIDRLKKVGPGHYRSTEPVPVWGSWKTLLRVQDGYTLTAVPIYEPADDAIPAPEVPAVASSTRPRLP